MSKCYKCGKEVPKKPFSKGWGLSAEKKGWRCPKCKGVTENIGIYGNTKITKKGIV